MDQGFLGNPSPDRSIFCEINPGRKQQKTVSYQSPDTERQTLHVLASELLNNHLALHKHSEHTLGFLKTICPQPKLANYILLNVRSVSFNHLYTVKDRF